MEFITLEDTTALYDATLFPEVYGRCHQLLSPNQPYVVHGVVEETFGVITLTVFDLQLLEPTSDRERYRQSRHETWYGEGCDPAKSDLPPRSFPIS